jgi:hypothetical protein
VIVDYLTFTFPREAERSLRGVVAAVDPGAVALDTKNGYREDWSLWGVGRFQWGHRAGMVARASLPGSGLGLYREAGGQTRELLDLVAGAEGRCTRVDLAFDWAVDAGEIIDRIVEHVVRGLYASRWRLENSNSCYRTRSVCGRGDTLYLGSSQSDCRVRVYEKAAERGVKVDWLRVEVQVRKEGAEAVDEVKALIPGYLAMKVASESDGSSEPVLAAVPLGTRRLPLRLRLLGLGLGFPLRRNPAPSTVVRSATPRTILTLVRVAAGALEVNRPSRVHTSPHILRHEHYNRHHTNNEE